MPALEAGGGLARPRGGHPRVGFSIGSFDRPVWFPVRRDRGHRCGLRAPDADAGVGPPLVDAIGGLSRSSGTGAAFMSWVPDRPAACAGVVLHFSHLMSAAPSLPAWIQVCAPLHARRRPRRRRCRRRPGLFSHGGSFFGFFFAFLTGLSLAVRVLGDVRGSASLTAAATDSGD